MKGIELTGYIDENHHLVVEEEIPLEPQKVRVVIQPLTDEDRKRRAKRLRELQGSLKDWGVDGMEYQREMRKEWDDRASWIDERLK